MLNKFKSHSLRTHLLTLYVLLALISGILIPVVSAWLSVNGFHEYQLQRRQANFDALAESLTDLYSEDLRWDKKRVSDILRPAPQWMGMTIKLNDFNNQNIFTLSPIASFNRGRRNNNAQPVRASKPEVLNIELKFNNKLIGILNIEHRAPSARFEQAFANYMLKRMLIGAAIMIIAACGLGFLVAGSLSRPVVNALKLTKQISKGDYNLNSKIQETGIIEMDDLTRGVEDLSRALASQEKFRQRLMTDIAHELKTPLTASRTQLEAMADGVFEATPERLELCLNELDRLSNLIQSVESLTRLEGDNLNIKLEKINLSEYLNIALDSFEPLFNKANIKLTRKITQNIFADIDAENFRHVIDNLLSNALRYTQAGGFAETRLFKLNHKIIIEVEDTGTGISEQDLPHIFDRFYRADESRAKVTGGRGVGLAIARASVEAHGGKISASSTYGKGSCFRVEL